MAEEREVAGLRCSEVLALLPDLLDGEVDPAQRAQIEEHLRGCDWCERFGGAYAALVVDLKALGPASPRRHEPPPTSPSETP